MAGRYRPHMTQRQMLTRPGGPVVVSEKTLRALTAIRREKLMPLLFGRVAIARSVYELMQPAGGNAGGKADWLEVLDDRPAQVLPERIAGASPSDAATLRLALALPASLVLLDGPIKERAKLSFIKAEGTVAILVDAYRQGHLSAVQPMVKALQALGHADVVPPPEVLDALWRALGQDTQ